MGVRTRASSPGALPDPFPAGAVYDLSIFGMGLRLASTP